MLLLNFPMSSVFVICPIALVPVHVEVYGKHMQLNQRAQRFRFFIIYAIYLLLNCHV